MSGLEYPYVPRRVITGVRDGQAVFLEDGPTPNAHHYASIPGMMTSVVYLTASPPSATPSHETAPPSGQLVPKPGETALVIVTFPPDAVYMSSDFNGPASGAEQVAFAGDFAATFDPDSPGMHRTESVDYDIVLDGEIWLELDDETKHLRTGDVVVQHSTRHAWRNKGDRPVTMCFVLVGAQQS